MISSSGEPIALNAAEQRLHKQKKAQVQAHRCRQGLHNGTVLCRPWRKARKWLRRSWRELPEQPCCQLLEGMMKAAATVARSLPRRNLGRPRRHPGCPCQRRLQTFPMSNEGRVGVLLSALSLEPWTISSQSNYQRLQAASRLPRSWLNQSCLLANTSNRASASQGTLQGPLHVGLSALWMARHVTLWVSRLWRQKQSFSHPADLQLPQMAQIQRTLVAVSKMTCHFWQHLAGSGIEIAWVKQQMRSWNLSRPLSPSAAV
mmetsp:Transcript_40527/g.72892  ORF Transcript_40527/g.72892 Transcript_40527/m.72892 type:complete len:260 (-) Transcript_40527:200-979(-)